MSKYQVFKSEKFGTFWGKIKSCIASSPDVVVTSKCHGKCLIEIKCLCSIRDKKILESVRECEFLSSITAVESLSRNYKYCIQIICQMAIIETLFCHFVVWTPKEIFIEKCYLIETTWQKY